VAEVTFEPRHAHSFGGRSCTAIGGARNTSSYLELLQTLDHAYLTGDLYLIADNLASLTSGPIRERLEAHPRVSTLALTYRS